MIYKDIKSMYIIPKRFNRFVHLSLNQGVDILQGNQEAQMINNCLKYLKVKLTINNNYVRVKKDCILFIHEKIMLC